MGDLTLVSTDETQDTLTKCNKIRDRIRSITNRSGNDDEMNMKIRFNSDGDLPFKKD